jgi:RAC serine/threonine-protein kinase
MAESWGTNRVVKEGWLQKRGEFIKNWRARYFVLRSDGTFTGYKQPPVGGIYPEIMNEFNVEGISVIPKDNIRKNAFMVRVLHLTSFVERIFCADTSIDRDQWMDLIKKTSDELRNKRRPSPSLYEDSESQETSLTTSGHVHEEEEREIRKPSPKPRAAPRKPKPKQKTLEDFEMLKVLGKGTFGKVVLCKEKQSKKLYAMKILKKDFIEARDEVEHTETERKILKTMKHPFLTVRTHIQECS